ncbi:MAG: PAS domain S-box protein [Chloroflexi bacterium]|nr:PAS domain S-box protein [Chloroflexota bacterium]
MATQRQAASAELRSPSRDRLLVEQAQEVAFFYELGPEPRFTYMGPESETVLGYPPDALLDEPALFSQILSPDDRSTIGDLDALPEVGTHTLRLRATHRSGQAIWVELVRTPVRDYQGTLVAIHGLFRDVTKCVLIERELQAAKEALRDAQRRIVEAQESVRGALAHHLHGQIQGQVILALQELRQARDLHSSSPEQAADNLSQALEILDRVLVSELSDLTQQLDPFVIPIGLMPMLRRLVEPFERSFHVELSTPPEPWAARALADRHGMPSDLRIAIYRLVQETLNNAAKHAKATSVRISMALLPDGHLMVTVKDDGAGFDVASTPQGFGLRSLQDYCASQMGSLTIESRPSHGTTIIATFPWDSQ